MLALRLEEGLERGLECCILPTHIHQEYPRDILRKQGNTERQSRLRKPNKGRQVSDICNIPSYQANSDYAML